MAPLEALSAGLLLTVTPNAPTKFTPDAMPSFPLAGGVIGRDITLIGAGGVGTAAAPLSLAANIDGQGHGGVVNVVAVSGDIGITQTVGDLWIGRTACTNTACQYKFLTPSEDPFGINTQGGSVTINVPNGGIFDGSAQTAVSAISDSQLQDIENRLGLLKPTNVAPDQTPVVLAFDAEILQYYHQYWRLLLNGSASGSTYQLDPGSVALYQPLASAALDGATPTTQQVDDYAQYLWSESLDFFNNVAVPADSEFSLTEVSAPLPAADGAIFGSGWQTTEAFDPALQPPTSAGPDPSFKLSSTTSPNYTQIVNDVNSEAYFTAGELQTAVSEAAMGSASPTVGSGAVPDVVGHQINITTATVVGRQNPPLTISVQALISGDLCSLSQNPDPNCITSEDVAALGLATAPGEVTVSGTISGGGTFSNKPLDAIPSGGTAVTLSVSENAPLFFAGSNELSINTPGNVFVQSTSPTAVLGSVKGCQGTKNGPAAAGCQVNLTSPGTILGGTTTGTRIDTGTGDLVLTAIGDVAQSDNDQGTITPLAVQIGGTLLSADTGGDLALEQLTGDLTFLTGSIASSGTILLDLPHGVLSQNLNGCNPSNTFCIGISGNGVDLQVPTGNVGSANSPLQLKLGTGLLSALAPNGIYINTDGSAAVGSLSALNGNIVLDTQAGPSEGDLNLGNASTFGKITSNGKVSLFADGAIYEVGTAGTDATGCETPPTSSAVTSCSESSIDAPQLVMKAALGIGTQTAPVLTHVAQMQVDSFRDMWVKNYGDVSVVQFPGITGGLTAAGTLNLTVGSNLTVTAPIASGGNPIGLIADGNVTIEVPVNSTGTLTDGLVRTIAGGNVTFSGGGYINSGSALTTIDSGYSDSGLFPSDTATANSGPGSIVNSNSAGVIDVTAAGIALAAHGGSVGSGSSYLLVDHTGTGDFGAITGDTGIYLDQTGGPFQISQATSATGDIHLTDVTSGQLLQMVNSGSAIQATAGSVYLNSDYITLDPGTSVSAGSAIAATAAYALAADDSTVTSGTGSSDPLTLHAEGGALTVEGSSQLSSGGTLTLNGSGDLTVDDSTVDGGVISLVSGGAAYIQNGAELTSTTGTSSTVTGLLSLSDATLTSGTSGSGDTSLSAGGAITALDSTVQAQDGSATLESTGSGVTLTGTVVSATPGAVNLKADAGNLQIVHDSTGGGSVTGRTNVLTSASGALTVNDIGVSATDGTITLTSGGNTLIESGASIGSGTGRARTSPGR